MTDRLNCEKNKNLAGRRTDSIDWQNREKISPAISPPAQQDMAVKRLSLLEAATPPTEKDTDQLAKRQKTHHNDDDEEPMEMDAFHMSSLSDALSNFPAKTSTSASSRSPTSSMLLSDIQANVQPSTWSSLAADSWAQIMGYLPLLQPCGAGGILDLSAASKFFHRDVSKLLRKLVVTSPRQMCPQGPLGITKRFAGIREIDVECLIRIDPNDGTRQLCPETANSLVKFLSNFEALERVWVGGVDPNTSTRYGYKSSYSACLQQSAQDGNAFGHGRGGTSTGRSSRIRIKASDAEQHIMRRLIMEICSGYRDGRLSPNMTLRGVLDWQSSSWASTFRCEPLRLACSEPSSSSSVSYECGLCENVCRSFPLEHVVQMKCGCDDNNQSNYSSAAVGSACPSFSKRLSIVASRRGGIQAIRKIALSTAFARQSAFMSKCVLVDADGLPAEAMGYGGTMGQVIHFHETMRWDDIEAALHYIDASEIGYPRLIKWLLVQPSFGSSMGNTTRGSVLITKSAFDKLRQLGFYLHPSDFRAVIGHENDEEMME